ncbi:CRAL/TRIO domain-containing protein [Bimuria novae-zelandiae CBS 107.79]|uniref:CRAL/TRIO domain-containing protein n=1 Tax=Bimuria novae-zelandiae CBS 107.79 TaxID=1447943 RepID=A0A6A5UV33_9PLEO|nr:CRAL/TRIO domain-containing protein [Bimuria novae-zelandiae CBS 107.79]
MEPSPSTSSAFEEFVELCEKEGLLQRPNGLAPEDTIDGINDTTTLKRFFVARNSDPAAALQQFKQSFEARKQVHDISTYENIDADIYERTRKIYPHWTGRRSKRGLPICVYTVSALDQATLTEYDKTGEMPHVDSTSLTTEPNQAQRAFAFHDTLMRFILPLCSAMRDRPSPETPISAAIIVVDVAAFGLKQAWNVRSYAQNISRILATSYPEVLDTVYVANAPFYFSKLWSIVKVFIDPRTTEKLVILTQAETLPVLSEVIEVESIPVQCGGTFEYEPGMRPSLDEGMQRQLQWIAEPGESLPPGPLKWIVDEEGRRTAVVTGSANGERVRLPFARLEEKKDSRVATPLP